ncbi:MAG: manganese efflux pump [Chloroflexi bacterium]|nr:manganese efflux pump [Chloroflexota bacterium]
MLIIIIAISLAMDCFAVSLGIGCSSVSCDYRSTFRLAFHFGFFQGGMAWLGWVIGNTILPYIEAYDHWVAFLLLAWIGIRMVKEGFSNEPGKIIGDPTRGARLIMLSIATSIDALGVGLSLSVVESDVLLTGLIIGIASTIFTVIGLKFGKKLNRRFGRIVEILGGLILITIGMRLVITHMIG